METRGNKKQRGKRVLAAVLATIMLFASAVTAMAAETVTITGESKDGQTLQLITINGVLGRPEEDYKRASGMQCPTYICSSDFEVEFLEGCNVKYSGVTGLVWKEAKHDPSTMTYTQEGYDRNNKIYELDGNKFVNPNDGTEMFQLNAAIVNEEGVGKSEYFFLVIDDSFVTSETETETEAAAEEAPAAAEEPVLARYTNSTVLVNGTPVEFEAYNINDNNYFKFRDVLMALSGTEIEFNLTWDEASQTIICDYGKYIPVGGELVIGDGTDKTAVKSSVNVIDPNDGCLWSQEAYKAYNINGNNYFKLRDLGSFLGFDVTWDGANNQILIDTTKPYTED